MIQWKLGCRSRKQKRKNQPIARPGVEHCHWFILPLLLATPTMQFSLDHKRRCHKQNQCSASDSIGLIFTRSYLSALLITTLTTTPLLVKTSLYMYMKIILCVQEKEKWKPGLYNIAVSCSFIFQLGADVGVSNPSMKSMKTVMRIMAVIAIPMTAQFPAVSVAIDFLLCHWTQK